MEVDLAGRQAPLHRLRLAADRSGHARGFQRCRLAITNLLGEHATELEQAHAAQLAGSVAAQRGDQAWQQRRAHHGQFGRQRVGQRHQAVAQLPLAQQCVVDEGEIDGFLLVTGDQLAAHAQCIQLGFARHRHARGTARQRGRDLLVTVDAGQLFDQVFFDGDVEAAARRGDLPAFGRRAHVHAQRAQDALDFGVFDGDAEHAGDAGAAQHDGCRLRQIGFTHGLCDRRRGTAGQVQHQAGGVLDRGARQRRIDAALEAVAGIGVQAQLAATAHDRGRGEVRGLQEHGGGGVGDTGVEAAHQAGQADRTISVGDHQEAVVQRGIAAVQ